MNQQKHNNKNSKLFISCSLIALCSAFLSTASFAASLSPEAARILSKKNRKLEAPPKSLKASEANVDLRYASGQKRLAANDAPSGNLELETIPVTNPSDYRNSGGSLGFDFESTRASKLDRIFGFGFMSAGAYGVFGAEIDFALMENWTFGFGVGTGMDYASWGFHSRYLFQKNALSPFVELGYANWHLEKVSRRNKSLTPSHLARRFFSNDGSNKLKGGDTAHIFYPGFGVSYMMNSGLSLVAQGQYMIHLEDFNGGLTASAGIYYYF